MTDRSHLRGGQTLSLAVAAAAVFVPVAQAAAQVQYTTVALTGQPAPSTPAGVSYGAFTLATLNDAGQITFLTELIGSGVTSANDTAMYAGAPTSPQLVARDGNPTPGTPAGVNYLGLGGPALNDAGQVTYLASLTGGGVMSANDGVVYAGPIAAPQVVAREGDAAPGTSPGVNYSTFPAPPALNDAGQVTYRAVLTGSGVTGANNGAVYAGATAAPQLVARAGDAAPGTPAGVNYSSFTLTPTLNDAGQVGYFAGLTGSSVTAINDTALYAGAFAAPQLLAREGDAAPSTPVGVVYSGFFDTPALSDAGQVAYRASLTGGGVTSTNDTAVYAGAIAGPQLVARDGDAAPGTPAGVIYGDVGTPVLNDTGQVSYFTVLTGAGTTPSNNGAIYAGPLAAPQLVARKGEAAPGTPAGVNYASFATPALNDPGQVAYLATLAGTGVTGGNDQGLFAFDPALSGNLLIAREGDLFDVGGGDLRTIVFVGFTAGRSDDTPTGLSNDGTLAFTLAFTDGTRGLFTAVVPEPAGSAVLALAAGAMLRRRR